MLLALEGSGDGSGAKQSKNRTSAGEGLRMLLASTTPIVSAFRPGASALAVDIGGHGTGVPTYTSKYWYFVHNFLLKFIIFEVF